MHIVVCIKQVPDSAQIRIHPVTNTIMRQGVPTIINPYDLFALEEALRLRDRFGGDVTVMTMGPPMAEASLRKALAYGADRAILMTDRMFAGSDTLATSYVLSSGIAKIANETPVDIVFAGKQTIDGDTAQVGPGIATRLGLSQLTYVERITDLDADQREIVVHRRSEGGVQVLKSRLPCLVTMLEGSNRIRFASMDDMFRSARSDLTVWSAADAGITEVGKCGLRGSPTVVRKVFAPKPHTEKAQALETADKSAEDIAEAAIETLFAANPKLRVDLIRQREAG